MVSADIRDVESEAGVIASLVMNPELAFFSEHLRPNHFSDPQNAYVYYAVTELAKKGIKQVDAYNITNVLNANKSTKEFAKGAEDLSIQALNDLIDTATLIARDSAEEYKMLVDNVLNAAFRRDTYNKLVECERLCFNSAVSDIEQKIYSALDNVMLEFSTNNDVPQYKDVVDDIWAEIKARQRGESPAIEFPFPTLNKYVVMEPGEVICFGGGPKSGKSSMLLTCTVDLLKKGKSVLVIDSEISTKLYTLRLLAHITKIGFGRLRSGEYTAEEAQQLEEAIAWLKTRKFVHIYLPVFDENAVYIAAKKAKHMIDIDVIVVDYLKSTCESDEAFSVYNEMGRFSDTLKNRIAGDLGICGLTAVQTTATGKIADSSKVARSLSTIILISDKTPDEIVNDDTGADKKMRVVFNRNGAQMQQDEWIDVKFTGSYVLYEETPKQHTIIEPF